MCHLPARALALLLVALGGCGDDSGADNDCPPGQVRDGDRCIPDSAGADAGVVDVDAIADIDAGGDADGGADLYRAINFDDPLVTYTFLGFEGAEDSSVQPDPTGANNNVARVNRSDTAATFAGTVVSIAANSSIPAIPFDASNTIMTVRTYSPATGLTVRLALENQNDGGTQIFVDAATTVADEFETLSFDFGNTGGAALDLGVTYDKVIIFFNFGVDGATAGAQTFYFDDIDFVGGGGLPPVTTFMDIDFEGGAETFADFGGAASSLVTDPTDASNTVARFLRTANAETFAGTTVVTRPGDTVGVIPFDNDNTRISVRVYSPAADTPVLLKVEDAADSGISSEVTVTTTMSGAFETLTFDFAGGTPVINPANSYNRLSIFMNFGLANGPEEEYFFDDVDFAGGGGLGGGAVVLRPDPADAVISYNGGTPNVEADDIGGAAFGDAAAGSVYVIPFVLPSIPSGGFTSAGLEINVQSVGGAQTNVLNADLYGLPYRAAATVAGSSVLLASMYHADPTADASATLLVDDFLTPTTATGATTTDSAGDTAIVDYLNVQVTAGAVAGDYVYLRLSPDLAAPIGAATTWVVAAAINATDPADRPSLTVE